MEKAAMAKTNKEAMDNERVLETESNDIKNKTHDFNKKLKEYMLSKSDLPFELFIKSIMAYVARHVGKLEEYTREKIIDMAIEFNILDLKESTITEKQAKKVARTTVVPIYGNLLQSVRLVTDTFRSMLRTEVVSSHSESIKNTQIIDRVFRNGGIADKYANDMKTCTKTMTKAIEENVKQEVYIADPEIIGYQWHSVLDGVTSQTCQGLNGSKYFYKRSGYKPRPPQHPNCRSFTSPLHEDRSKDAKIQSFEQWAKNNDEELKESLGKTRYNLYKRGKLPIGKFTDVYWKPLTLEQLKKRNAPAFEAI